METGTLSRLEHRLSDETLNRGPDSLWSLKIPWHSSQELSTDRVVDLEKLRSSVLVNGDSLDRMVRRDEESNHGTTYVALTVALLCILQATLNICLRLYSVTVRTEEERQRVMDALGEFTRLGWLYYNHRLYFISTTKKNWTVSRDYCLERDADLVVINSREEQVTECVSGGGGGGGHFSVSQLCCHDNRYHYYLKQEFVSRQAGPYWTWIGLSDGDTEGTWKWVDGTIMTSSFWRRGQPDDYGGGEDCVATSLGDDWNDASCAIQYSWICEKVLVLDHLEAELNKEVMREEAPQIYGSPSSKTVSVGNTAIFSCRAWGRPQPTVQWLLDGRLLETDGTDNRPESVVRMNGGYLLLRGVRSGVETVVCMATNSAGTANHTARLLVYVSQLCCHDNRYHYYLKQEFVRRQAGDHWIGLSDGDTEGTWKWVDGTIMTSSFWVSGQPNDYGGGQDCVSTREDGWNDDPCAYQYHWICEKV
ncbi:CD209 antigen-like protein D [Merluccius polli]|uniref:CD209 antigen-like protein D n=1 Tax=Merluccius polli TaxID=89951 RepID=A0AA47NVD3_MERPO|nr:CD209 antigen-like protein D [Merluccius polli]